MGSLRRIVWSALSAGLLLLPTAAPVKGQTSEPEEWLKSRSILFGRRVVKGGEVSFAELLWSPRTIVVSVDEVLEAPAAVSLLQGDQVTVEAKDPSQFRDGALVTFDADAWIFGSGGGVKNVGHEISPTSSGAGGNRPTREELAQIRKELSDAELRSGIQRADIVVVGRVTAIRPGAMRTVGERPSLVVTEHAPDWQEAIVQVESGIKGARAGQEIVIRFPGSLDVAWYGFPKLKPGEEGTFLLQKDSLSGSPKAMLAGAEVDTYVAGSRQDVLPKSEAERVRTLARP